MNRWIPAAAFGFSLVGYLARDLWGNNDAAYPFGVILILGFLVGLLTL
jgi:hypothetical protein